MFPGPNAQMFYNEAGEPLGWDYPSYDDPQDGDAFYAMDDIADEEEDES